MLSFLKIHYRPKNSIYQNCVTEKFRNPTWKWWIRSVSWVKKLPILFKCLVSNNQKFGFILSNFSIFFNERFFLFAVRINNFVNACQSRINVQSCNSNSMIMIPIISGFLLIWVIINSLIWSAHLLCSKTWCL